MSVRPPTDSSAPNWYSIAVAIVLIVAAALRLYGQDWDEGHYFHPDERFVATVMSGRLAVPPLEDVGLIFDPDNSPLNTRSNGPDGEARAFAYGSLPFLIATLLGSALSGLIDTDLTSYENVGQFGRFLTAIIDIGSVGLVMLYARVAFGFLASVIAGALTATSVVLIQLAHFFTVDTWVTFFTIAVLYSCLMVTRTFDVKWSLLAAGLAGAALATKASVGVLAIPIIVATILGVRVVARGRANMTRRVVRRLLVSAVPAIGVFAVFEPYALWRREPFIDDIRAQWEIVNGNNDVPFTRQFVGTVAGINEIENLVLWGVAPGFGIAMLVATAIGIHWAIMHRDIRYLLLLSWIIPYFYVIASSEARFLRYSAPLVPPLAIMVGHQLGHWWYRTRGTRIYRTLAGVSIVVVVGITLAWSLAFMTVYGGTHPRIDASQWIFENVEAGSTLTREVWDDTLPVRMEGQNQTGSYEHLALDLYADRPPAEAFEYIAEALREADYIVLASQRLSHSIPRLPWRYPVQSAYYRLLEQEMLGFELAHESTNYPGLGSYRINTLDADESFSVYDHPPVRIYRKVEELSVDDLQLRFAYALNQPWIPDRQPDAPTLLLNEPVDDRAVSDDVAWSSGITHRGPVAILVWLIVLLGFGISSLPITILLFARFGDLGIGFANLVGLLSVGSVVWLLWSLGIAPFSLWTILFAVVAVSAASWGVLGVPERPWTPTGSSLRLIVAGQAVFVVSFGLFLLLRALNPDLWHPIFGGEKPMETAYLNAIARSESFPPYDPWYADGYINYYYYGFFLLAIIWKLTGVPIDTAFQLSLATVAGLLASGVFSLASTLSASVLHTSRTGWLAAGGLLAVTMTTIAGNLDAILQVLRRRTLDVDFWQSSRVVEFAINEFPYFSLLYGDVHPHLIAAPVMVLILALAYSWIQNGRTASGGWIVLWAAGVTVTLASLTVINFWDGPTAGVILIVALVVPVFRRGGDWIPQLFRASVLIPLVGLSAWLLLYPFHTRLYTPTTGLEWTSSGTRVSQFTIHFGLLLLPVAIVAAAAMYGRFRSRGFRTSSLYLGAGIAGSAFLLALLFGPERSAGAMPIWLLLPCVLASGALVTQAIAWIPLRFGHELGVLAVLPFVALGGGLAVFRSTGAAAAFLVALFILLWVATSSRNAGTFLAICGASAAGLIMLADIVYLADHLRDSEWERMNTVFKLFFQSWILLAIIGSAGLLWMAHRFFCRLMNRDLFFGGVRLSGRSVMYGATLVTLVFALCAFAYPGLATSSRLEQRMPSSPPGLTLAGYEWMQGGQIRNQVGDVIDFTGDYHAIEWLSRAGSSNAVVLEASIGPYRGGGSRISSATGMPTVLGWDSHQSQQRDSIGVRTRMSDVRELYQSDDVDRKRYLLRQYNISYVVVGDVERYSTLGNVQEGSQADYYSSPAGLEAFEEMVGDDLEIAFEEAGTRIYRVVPFPTAGQVR